MPGADVAVWLGSAPPVRSIRWLDGALAAAAKFGAATAIAAGERDLARSRRRSRDARRPRERRRPDRSAARLSRLGADRRGGGARARRDAPSLVDEASRPERFPEVAAIAELLDAAQLTHVVALAPDGDGRSREPHRAAASCRRCACAAPP